MNKTNPIKSYLEENILLFDGAMGTYYSSLCEDPLSKCEYANITSPNTIKEIHTRYLKAGAKAIKTNTFSIYADEIDTPLFPYQECIKAGYEIATSVAKEYDAFVFCDIGPIQLTHETDLIHCYQQVIDEFIKLGGQNYLFESFLDDHLIPKLSAYIKSKVPDAYIIVCYGVHPDGFSKSGAYGQSLLNTVDPNIDSIGLNCICGPNHMKKNLHGLNPLQKPLVVMPNASYPTVLGNRVCYEHNPNYYAKEIIAMIKLGARIVGGCCGTTPTFIQHVHQALTKVEPTHSTPIATLIKEEKPIKKSHFYELLKSDTLPIAVELDSPLDSNISEYLTNASLLKNAGVDLITIADCPVARARMDSSLVACKLKRELSISVLPHMTCRDRNINASKALLLGLTMEDIQDILIITGDPIPSEQRNEVKAVYEFNSRMFIHQINQLNHTLFDSPFYLYAALNLNATNFHVQLRLAQSKITQGANAFLTQPVLSKQGLENLKLAKETLSVPIVGGILPIVSHQNATFINNEIPGINVCDEILTLYEGKSKEEATQLAIDISSEIATKIKPYIDGYYIITPFKRVDIVTNLIHNIKKNLTTTTYLTIF